MLTQQAVTYTGGGFAYQVVSKSEYDACLHLELDVR
jgi:hypothetical protein